MKVVNYSAKEVQFGTDVIVTGEHSAVLDPQMTDEVYNLESLKKEAYQLGYYQFEEPHPSEPEIEPTEALSHFMEGSGWVNNIHPHIRAMAGYADAGYGTWKVIVTEIPVRLPDGEYTEMTCGHIEDELLESYREGVYDKID